MRIISESSLICFLWDLRRALAPFRGEMPGDIYFINADSFYFYLRRTFPGKHQEIGGLMGVLEPFIPVIVSERNLLSLLAAYAGGSTDRLAQVEQAMADRSRVLFINSAMTADNDHWENMIGICCQVRQQRLARI